MAAVVETCITCLKRMPPGGNAVFRDRVDDPAVRPEFRNRTSTHLPCYLGSSGDGSQLPGRAAARPSRASTSSWCRRIPTCST
jgi:hypothetical protein